MNKLNERKLETDPDNPSMGDVNDITASTQEKYAVIRNNSGKSTERTTKVSQLIRYFIQLRPQSIHCTHTTNCPNTSPTGMPTTH